MSLMMYAPLAEVVQSKYSNVSFSYNIYPDLEQIDPTRAAQSVWVNQDIKQTFNNGFSVLAVTLDTIRISQRQYG
jgi:hypothetical protein